MTKKILILSLTIIFVCLLMVLWGIRVADVNSQYDFTEQIYEKGDEFRNGDWSVCVKEGFLMTGSAFGQEYAGGLSGDSGGYQVGIRLHVSYLLQESLTDSDIVDNFCSTGFRTRTWFNGMDPFLFADINKKSIEEICETGEGDLVLVAQVSPTVMSEKNYRNISEQEFYYVYKLYPENIMIKVEHKENK